MTRTLDATWKTEAQKQTSSETIWLIELNSSGSANGTVARLSTGNLAPKSKCVNDRSVSCEASSFHIHTVLYRDAK